MEYHLDRIAGELLLIAELLQQLDGLLHVLAGATDGHLQHTSHQFLQV